MKRIIVTYCTITFTVTWTIAFGIYWIYTKRGLSQYQLNLYHSFAAIGPTIGAFVTTYYFYGRNGLNKLLGKIRFRSSSNRTILVIFFPVLFFILGLFIYRIIKARWFSFGDYYLNNLSTATNRITEIILQLRFSKWKFKKTDSFTLIEN